MLEGAQKVESVARRRSCHKEGWQSSIAATSESHSHRSRVIFYPRDGKEEKKTFSPRVENFLI